MNSAFQGTTLQNFALLPVILSDPGQSIVIISIPFDPRVLSRPNHAATVFRFASCASALLCGCSVEMEDHKNNARTAEEIFYYSNRMELGSVFLAAISAINRLGGKNKQSIEQIRVVLQLTLSSGP